MDAPLTLIHLTPAIIELRTQVFVASSSPISNRSPTAALPGVNSDVAEYTHSFSVRRYSGAGQRVGEALLRLTSRVKLHLQFTDWQVLEHRTGCSGEHKEKSCLENKLPSISSKAAATTSDVTLSDRINASGVKCTVELIV